MNTYIPDSNRIVHHTRTDFSYRPIGDPVHLVQYDDRLPILAVSVFQNGQPYAVPSSASVNIRLSKPDKTFVMNPALGASSDRTVVYFEITQQMVALYGILTPIVEVNVDGKTAGSGPIIIIVDRNPVQEGDIESSTENKSIQQYVKEAKEAAESAKGSQTAAKSSETKAASSASAASASEQNAKSSETKAASSASAASTSAQSAKSSETNAERSATAASTSAQSAGASETRAATSASAASTSEKNAAASASAASTSEKNAGSSASSASTSAQSAKSSETNAEKSAAAASTSAQNAGTSETKAASSASAASASEKNAAASASAASASEKNAGSSAKSAQDAKEQVEAIAGGIANSDAVVLAQNLRKEHAVYDSLLDSSGEIILDSDSDNLEGRTVFADEEDVLSLKRRIDILDGIINELLTSLTISRLEKLEKHALLDSTY